MVSKITLVVLLLAFLGVQLIHGLSNNELETLNKCHTEVSLLNKCTNSKCNKVMPHLLFAQGESISNEMDSVRKCFAIECQNEIDSVYRCSFEHSLTPNKRGCIYPGAPGCKDDDDDDDTDDTDPPPNFSLCSATLCLTGFDCCQTRVNGAQCYNTTVFDCVDGLICPEDFLACGTHCFNPCNYLCVNGKLFEKFNKTGNGDDDDDDTDNGNGNGGPNPCDGVCPSGLACCNTVHHGPQCYNEATYDCVNGVLCPEDFLSCGEACYNSSIYRCDNGQLQPLDGNGNGGDGTDTTNGNGNGNGNGDNPDVTDPQTPLNCSALCIGSSCCLTKTVGPQCYNEATADCVDGLICPNEYLACGIHCYDPCKKLCVNGVLFKKFNKTGNGDDDDDDTDNGNGNGGPNPCDGVCPSGLACCNTVHHGPQCYNEATYDCVNGVLCPQGFLPCGNACYNPALNICSGGVLLPR